MKLYLQYADDVLSKRIVAGKLIKLACERFHRFILREDIEFREDKVDIVIEFVSIIKHYTGRHKGKMFTLQAWQQFIVASIYGFYVKKTGDRLTQFAYIEIARKNGKTAFASALCLYHLIADGESGAEVQLALQPGLPAWQPGVDGVVLAEQVAHAVQRRCGFAGAGG